MVFRAIGATTPSSIISVQHLWAFLWGLSKGVLTLCVLLLLGFAQLWFIWDTILPEHRGFVFAGLFGGPLSGYFLISMGMRQVQIRASSASEMGHG